MVPSRFHEKIEQHRVRIGRLWPYVINMRDTGLGRSIVNRSCVISLKSDREHETRLHRNGQTPLVFSFTTDLRFSKLATLKEAILATLASTTFALNR